MDFREVASESDYCIGDLRESLGVTTDEYVLLQPTRIIPRKRIEYAIELARRLDFPCALVISQASGDENPDYEAYLRDHAKLMNVKTIFAGDIIAFQRGQSADGQKIYSMADAYRATDLVTYPSTLEGFGNAFLEAVYYRRPLVMSAYKIFKADIQPKGFRVISFQDFMDDHTVTQVRAILTNPEMASEMAEHNYRVGLRHYSFVTLERRLTALIRECFGEA